MANVEAAGKEAQAAVDLNLMPMEISNVPTSKADVSDFTLVAARGGLMNLPTRQRKRYASQGFVEDDEIEIMEPESLGDFELQKEEGVNIGPMVAFPDTGNPMSNAQQVWESGQIDQGIYQMDFNIFFQSGDWMDYISKGKVEGDTQMASAPGIPGIEGLRHGGRPGYKDSNIEEFQITESVEAPEGYYDISTRDTLNPNEMLSEEEEFWNRKFSPEFAEQGQNYEKQQNEIYALAASIMQGPEGLSMEEALERAKAIYFKKGFVTKKEYKHPFETNLAKGGRPGYSIGEIVEDKETILETPNKEVIENMDTAYLTGEGTWGIDRAMRIWKTLPDDIQGGYGSFQNFFESTDWHGIKMKKGGRVKRDNGGIMNLGGLEKDYRTTGGFVPIGAYERKDDVPARLSKNEFVMTADAVRAAGGGSINRGAQRMYDTMKHLEARPEAKRMTA
jgi:hypothetical protein